MAAQFRSVSYAAMWLVVAAGIALTYEQNIVSAGTAMFLELCAGTLGVVGVIFWKKMGDSPETVEQLLYRTEHPTHS